MKKYVMSVQDVEGLNELDIALMSIDEIVLWAGRNVGWFDCWELMEELEQFKPGVTAAFNLRYPGNCKADAIKAKASWLANRVRLRERS